MHLGPDHALASLIELGNVVTGINTVSGAIHDADLVVLACGSWTPSLLPSVGNLLEATAGSVLSIQLPADRQDLWIKYAPENFPVWSWNIGSYVTPGQDVGGIYGLPRTPEGVIKIAFRGAKWTNYSKPSSESGRPVSHPWTDTDEVPEEAMRVLRAFCEENMPDLLELPLERGRLCWYTDSVDNSFLIDYVSDTEGLVVASGGSGHGFKFLPVLGEHVVNVIEQKQTDYTEVFRWRDVPDGERNGLEEGTEGWRTLGKQKMVGKRAWRKEAQL